MFALLNEARDTFNFNSLTELSETISERTLKPGCYILTEDSLPVMRVNITDLSDGDRITKTFFT